MAVEQVFKALADHHRRHLLDVLSRNAGLTLTQLASELPMSRYGVMKHLRILEEAGLITTRKVGREKLHYLDSDPMQEAADWIYKYRRFWDERFDRLEDYLHQLQQEEEEK
jgi:DNA-binding transcriptional ArsR family regulator